MHKTDELQANILCKSCGLCCTGHLFIWVRLKAVELDRSQALGLNVIRSDPRQRGFTQPCPLWQGQCTIYTSPDYPRVCRTYQCRLLIEVNNGDTPLKDALSSIEQVKGTIRELETHLPVASNNNFRERLVAYIESTERPARHEKTDSELRQKAESLLDFYEKVFGIKDLLDRLQEQR
ncbi:MAG: hypothetical protein HXY35_12080 [Chloroflexi bacterium]|nr:hypothetical protein [Chloroflexota bacterium]